ncbi:zf-HC2 domain-containing protein [Allokutzneria oryzae]|uniref:Zf-HC2 domain-containing protein n=1 Tax=Allokutzneria oryzae TaxID=1378989 RepID=A0ABV5ZSS1_9PSEU
MNCATCREALSARMDGEPEPVPETATDQHLRGCADCRSWQARATALTRTLRVRPAVSPPDLAPAVLAAAPAPRQPGRWTRAALVAVATTQLALGIAQLVGVAPASAHGGHDEPMGGHLFNESTAWNLALAVGMLWAALRARTVAGLLPVLTGFLVVLGGFSVHDLIVGAVPFARVASHVPLVIGLGLLYALHRQQRLPAPSSPDRTAVPVLRSTDAA